MNGRAVDVIVVGASTAGLAAALGLARAGLRVTVVDNVPAPRLSWTAIHHWSVLPLLDQLGVLDRALVAGEATARWGLRVLATGEQFDFDLRELGADAAHAFNLRLEPHRMRAILCRAFLSHAGTNVVEGQQVVGLRQQDTVSLALSGGDVLQADWVVGADGPASAVRRQAGLGFEGTTWTERGVVALLDHDFARDGYLDTTFQIDGHAGAVVERVGQRTWRYVYQESLALDEASLQRRLGVLLHDVTGSSPEVLDWSSARMHQRSATSYSSGRVVLIGAAAHMTPPMTGHTSLSSWFDATTLVPALASVVGGGSDVELAIWADRRRREFLDDAAPLSLGRRNLVAQIRDQRRLEVELDAYRRASVDREFRRQMLRAESDATGR